ncbi:MAG TPA: hypothetical protein VLN48_16320 [Bryobacteraceae bacterium]|nr:hypothetical protein [Bryobacteraceae bacterium]
MRRHLHVLAAVCLIGGIARGQNTQAQDNAALLDRLRAMEDRIKALEAEVAGLKGQPAPEAAAAVSAAAAPAPAPQVAAAPSIGGAQGAAAKVFNPDMAVIGDFIGVGGKNRVQPSPALEMHESEVALQAILDPYARADFFISFGEHGVDLEEGYLTFPSLPGRLNLRAGKMRAAFGKVNTLHNHVLPWVDRPLVMQNFTGGEEGINDAGLSLTRILPAPGGLFLEATGQVFRGDSDNVFHSWHPNNLSTVGHLRGYRDITESTNVDLGFSYARGASAQTPGLVNQLYGMDATVRWKPLRRAIYHSFTGRAEFVWDRNDATLLAPAKRGFTAPQQTPFGYFVSGDYQFARRWFAGARFDWSDRALNAFEHDHGGSAVLTYWPSEFSQVRGQYRRTRYAEGLTANEILFQFLFSIGAHGAHPF